LPIIQLAVAAILLRSEYGQIGYGLNAPALLFKFLDPNGWGPTFGRLPQSILGFHTDDCFFLIGVIVVWYFVGRVLDGQRISKTSRVRGGATVLIVLFLLLALGVLIFPFALLDLLGPEHFRNVGHLHESGLLALIWSISLICASIRGFLMAMRHREAAQREHRDCV
jgi:hypothetical protein